MVDSWSIADHKETDDIECFEDRQETIGCIEGWGCKEQAEVGAGKNCYCCLL